MFKVKITDEGAIRTLDLAGRLMLGQSAHRSREGGHGDADRKGHKRIVFDFSNTGAIDSAGIGALAIYRKRAGEQKASIKAVIPKKSAIPMHVQTPIRLLYDTHDDSREPRSYRFRSGPACRQTPFHSLCYKRVIHPSRDLAGACVEGRARPRIAPTQLDTE